MMLLWCSMSRWLLVVPALLLLASHPFVRADNPAQNDDDDDCLIYEDEVDFLDSLQSNSYTSAEKWAANDGDSQNTVVGTLQPRDPSPFAAFELLDGLVGPTDAPIEFLDALRPVGRTNVEKLDSLHEPTKSTSSPSVASLGMPGKYDGFELLDTLPEPTEQTIDLLDAISSVGYSKKVTAESTPSPPKEPSKYEGFEQLDSIPPEVHREASTMTTAAPTPVYVPPPTRSSLATPSTSIRSPTSRLPIPQPATPATPARPTYKPPVVNKLQPARDDLKGDDHKPTILPTLPILNRQTKVYNQFNDMKWHRGIYDDMPEIITPDPSTYTTKTVRPPPATTSRPTPRPIPVRKPTSPLPMYPVRDHLEVPNKKTVILPAEPVPNYQEMIDDQFNEIKRYRGLYDVAPRIPSTKKPVQTPKYVPRPITTTSRPFVSTKKIPYESNPVRDHLEVPDFSTIILPAQPLPNREEPIFDQFEDFKRYGGIYDVAAEIPKTRSESSKPDSETYTLDVQPYPNKEDVVLDQFGEIRGYDSPAKTVYGAAVDRYLMQPLAPVLDEFVTNDVGYGRPKRAIISAAATSTQSKPKRKCLKRRPKISHKFVKPTEVPKITEPSADAIQSSREASTRCVGHRHGDFVPIGHCKKFYFRCDHENKLMMCTRHGEVFSHSLYGCVPKAEAPECPSYVASRPISATIPLAQNGTLEEFCQLRSDGFYRHFADCARVIQCFDGDAFEYPPCPKKLVFDEKRGTCEYKRNVLGC